MGDDSFIGILFFGAIAVFLAHRLWQVLGRRDGEAPPASPDQLMARGALAAPVDRIVPAAQKPIIVAPGDPLSLEGSIAQIKQADPSFDERQFVSGAIMAFKMIVASFASGDRDALRPLLSDVVYRSFDQAIADREAGGQRQEITIPRVTGRYRKRQPDRRYGADRHGLPLGPDQRHPGPGRPDRRWRCKTDRRRAGYLDIPPRREIARSELDAG